MADKNIHAGHRKRMKMNVSENGFSQLEEHELLELLLFYSIPRADTNELAHKLIDKLGGLENVFRSDVDRLKSVDGVGDSTAVMLGAMGEVYARMREVTPDKRKVYKTVSDLKTLCSSLFVNADNEKVYLLGFDGAKRLAYKKLISQGTEFFADLNVRNVVKAVMDSKSALVVLVHNHPMNKPEPSPCDIDSTRNLAVMLRKLGFALADHIIVGCDGEAYSMHSDKRFTQMFY